jgi:pSer/pThr/pTyr-binding forkhead associated (FHA) protein
MPTVTFRVIDGIDKGRVFRDLPTPVTIGREEGNLLRLNDERVSRYHAKVQFDNGEVILTDLESTNGTRVNNTVVQIRRLKPGDRVSIGRSQLLFGTDEEIETRKAQLSALTTPSAEGTSLPATLHAGNVAAQGNYDDADFELATPAKLTQTDGTLFLGNKPLPPLPQKMSPAQAARLAELLDFLHRHLTAATDDIRANDDGTQVTLKYPDWQRVVTVQMLLARYVRAIAEPDVLEE